MSSILIKSALHRELGKVTRRGRAVSLFSGCGGSDIGMMQAGFDVIFANDIIPYAKKTYEENLPSTDYYCQDIADIKVFPQADLLAGCYPCQGFSQGGARDSDRKINYLYRQFDRALRQIKPKAFIVENVSGMQRSDFKHLLQNQITRFRMAGYKVSWSVLNAVDYGVAQERKRIFIVGIRSDFNKKYIFPSDDYFISNIDRKNIGDVLKGMPLWPEGEYFEDDFHWYYMSRNRRRDWTQPSKTIVSHPRHMPLHPISPEMIRVGPDHWKWASNAPARRFSYREAALLQGFPVGWSFPDGGTMREKYTVVGNAVPPPLFKAVAEVLPDIW